MRTISMLCLILFTLPAASHSESTTAPEVPCYNEQGELIGSNVPVTECEHLTAK